MLEMAELPFCEIVDVPRYPWRGAHLDVARWCHPIAFVRKFVDLAEGLRRGQRFEVTRLTSLKGLCKVGPEFFEPLPEEELKLWEGDS